MKNNRILFIILTILVLITIFFIVKNSNTTVRKELSDFAVKDTSAITKIFIADRNGNQVTLERKAVNNWSLNDKYEPRPELLKLLLDVIYRMDVRNRVAKAAYNNVIKALASSGIKCEIYLNGSDQPFKTYYVGGQTEDALGTFMIIDKSNMPFVTEIPGFNGYLTPRYSANVEAWRKPVIFQTPLGQIKSLTVSYANFPDKSFNIQSENGKYIVRSPDHKTIIGNVDSVAVENYLSFYSAVYYESRAKELLQVQKDSMLRHQPSITLSLNDASGINKELFIYPMPVSSASLVQQDSIGNPLKYDVDRMYGFLKPENDFFIIQHYTFDKLLRQLTDFEITKQKNR